MHLWELYLTLQSSFDNLSLHPGLEDDPPAYWNIRYLPILTKEFVDIAIFKKCNCENLSPNYFFRCLNFHHNMNTFLFIMLPMTYDIKEILELNSIFLIFLCNYLLLDSRRMEPIEGTEGTTTLLATTTTWSWTCQASHRVDQKTREN